MTTFSIFPLTALRLYLNADSGLCRQLIMQILTNLWAIQKWMRTQKVFQFYSSSILIVYDARKLRQVIELQKRQQNSLDGSNVNCNNNQSDPSSGGGIGGVEDTKLKRNRNDGGSGDKLNASSPTEKEPPKVVYKKIQRSHSSMNNYEQVIAFFFYA